MYSLISHFVFTVSSGKIFTVFCIGCFLAVILSNPDIIFTADDRRVGKRPDQLLCTLQFFLNKLYLFMQTAEHMICIYFRWRIDLDLILTVIPIYIFITGERVRCTCKIAIYVYPVGLQESLLSVSP